MNDNAEFTITQAANELRITKATIRRYIKLGKVKAELRPGKFGNTYVITNIPAGLYKASPSTSEVNIPEMISRLEQLNSEVGYWRGKYEELDHHVKLLEAPKHKPWYIRWLTRAKS